VRHAGIRGGRGGDELGTEADRHHEHAGEHVGEVRAVDGDASELIDAGGSDQRAGDQDRSGSDAAEELGAHG
jgi:hypothetical protein